MYIVESCGTILLSIPSRHPQEPNGVLFTFKIMNKERRLVHDKYNGRCAYCGDPLLKGWHVDHILPIRRNMKYDHDKHRFVPDGTMEHPERDTIENKVPSCPSCNINKHSGTVEDFRGLIEGFRTSLNRDSTQYKISKRYGLIKEIDKPIKFHFETYEKH